MYKNFQKKVCQILIDLIFENGCNKLTFINVWWKPIHLSSMSTLHSRCELESLNINSLYCANWKFFWNIDVSHSPNFWWYSPISLFLAKPLAWVWHQTSVPPQYLQPPFFASGKFGGETYLPYWLMSLIHLFKYIKYRLRQIKT